MTLTERIQGIMSSSLDYIKLEELKNVFLKRIKPFVDNPLELITSMEVGVSGKLEDPSIDRIPQTVTLRFSINGNQQIVNYYTRYNSRELRVVFMRKWSDSGTAERCIPLFSVEFLDIENVDSLKLIIRAL